MSNRGRAKRVLGPIMVAGMLAVAAVGPAGAADEKTFVFGTNFDPQGGCDATQTVVIALTLSCPMLVSEPLVRFNHATNEVEPALAESWTTTEDSVTFKLRDGITFSDGTPFDADAVVFNFERVWDETSPDHAGLKFPYASQLAYKDIEKIDDSTVKVTLQGPQPNMLWGFTFFPAFIQSPTAVKAEGAGYTLAPVGTGPYKVDSYEDGVRIELSRNPTFQGTPPAPDRIVIDINSNQQSLASDLLAGNIDAMQNPPVEQVDQLTSSGFQIDSYPSAISFYFNLNVTKSPTDDPLVRQAMNYALDKESIATLSKNAGKAMYGAWFDGAYAFNPDVEQYKFDPAKAGELLDQAGWVLPAGGTVRQKDGQNLHVKLISQSGTAGIEAVMTPVLISNLQDVGFEVESEAMESATYISASGAGDKTLANVAQFGQGALFPDPQTILDRMTTEYQPPKEFNLSFYSNPDYDKLVTDARTELDESKRIDGLKQAQAIIREDAPLIWAVQAAVPVAFDPAKFSSVALIPNSIGLVDPYGIVYR